MAVNYHLMKLEHGMKALAMTTRNQRFNEVQRRIQSLPQELQDLIFDFTLGSFEPGETVTIDEDYQPPKALSINHAIRKKFAAQYYSNTKFIINFSGWRNFNLYLSCLWLRSVACEHLSLVKELRFRHDLITRGQICEELQQHEDWLSPQVPAKHIRFLAHVMAHTANGDRKLQWLDRHEIAALPCICLTYDVKVRNIFAERAGRAEAGALKHLRSLNLSSQRNQRGAFCFLGAYSPAGLLNPIIENRSNEEGIE